mgnify:FL=1|tara:strand:+ start:1001 stop:1216 length:216 start_codon:yes stop_codon:yes gene_type:complete
MNNIIYIKTDPILLEFDNSVDKNSAKKMLAFKYFNGCMSELESYLEKNNQYISNDLVNDYFIPKSQLELAF